MQTKLGIFVALLSCAAACAQDPKPPAAQRVQKPEAYVRRFSAGASLSVLVLPMVKKSSSNIVTTGPAVDSLYTTTGAKGPSQRIGYGITAQLAITERFALNAGVLLRRLGYIFNSDVYTGSDNPNTSADERTHTVKNEDTRARLLDLPVTVRYYFKDRHTPGPRGFVQLGGVVRQVNHIRTAIDTTVNDGTLQCCVNTPATPARRSVRGFVGGFGLQFIDPVGIRVVPEVRYTRWMGQTFNSFSTATQRHQVEAMISLTF